MSENDAETVTIEVTLEEEVRDAIRSIRQRQREQLAGDSWGRTVAELSEDDEDDDEALMRLLETAYKQKLRRKLRDPTGTDGPVGCSGAQCTPD